MKSNQRREDIEAELLKLYAAWEELEALSE
jgi:hypothetical protein